MIGPHTLRRARLPVVVLAAAGLLLAAPGAQARLIAAISQPGATDPHGIGQRNIRILDPLDPTASELDRDLRLQQSVNTSIDEIDVSLSADGRYLAFVRTHPFTSPAPAGVPDPGRLITDRSLERNSPLATKPMSIEGGFTGTGTISPNAKRFARHPPGITGMSMSIYSLDLSQRPIPATRIATIPSPFPNVTGSTGTPAFEFGGSRVAWSVDPDTGRDAIAVGSIGGTTLGQRAPELDAGRFVNTSDAAFWPCCRRDHILFTHSFGQANGDGGVFRRHVDLGGLNLSDETPGLFRFDSILQLAGVAGVADAEELAPKASPDGRYIVWIEKGTTQRIRIWDRLTQDEVNSGVPIGPRPVQSWALAQTDAPVIVDFRLPSTLPAETPATTLRAQLGGPISVGIIVQRVTGSRTLFGQRVPRLVPVGRVPLGRQRRGRVGIPWSGRVGGKRLRPGRYQITLRALRGRRVIDLSRPRLVRVR